MPKYAIILERTNKVQLVIEAQNMQTTADGYVVELPNDSLVKIGDLYNPETETFTSIDIEVTE
jgi:hypothetical protein